MIRDQYVPDFQRSTIESYALSHPLRKQAPLFLATCRGPSGEAEEHEFTVYAHTALSKYRRRQPFIPPTMCTDCFKQAQREKLQIVRDNDMKRARERAARAAQEAQAQSVPTVLVPSNLVVETTEEHREPKPPIERVDKSGTRLVAACAECDAENPSDARGCTHCGLQFIRDDLEPDRKGDSMNGTLKNVVTAAVATAAAALLRGGINLISRKKQFEGCRVSLFIKASETNPSDEAGVIRGICVSYGALGVTVVPGDHRLGELTDEDVLNAITYPHRRIEDVVLTKEEPIYLRKRNAGRVGGHPSVPFGATVH